MRKYSAFGDSVIVHELLEQLKNPRTSSEVYADSFYKLGGLIAKIVNQTNDLSKKKVLIACSSEDADWLSRGILDNLNSKDIRLAVFWNLRVNVFDVDYLTIAPIVKSYIESIDEVNCLIVSKSIIFTSCVVRTNLTYLINKINPEKIIITAPVIYKNAENTLKSEFNADISNKFEFIYFAEDDEINEKQEVVPGIGGSIYQRLNLGSNTDKNKYIPSIVKDRRLKI